MRLLQGKGLDWVWLLARLVQVTDGNGSAALLLSTHMISAADAAA
jgi:hypothetical protein